jgi:hypothetical protein
MANPLSSTTVNILLSSSGLSNRICLILEISVKLVRRVEMLPELDVRRWVSWPMVQVREVFQMLFISRLETDCVRTLGEVTDE